MLNQRYRYVLSSAVLFPPLFRDSLKTIGVAILHVLDTILDNLSALESAYLIAAVSGLTVEQTLGDSMEEVSGPHARSTVCLVDDDLRGC